MTSTVKTKEDFEELQRVGNDIGIVKSDEYVESRRWYELWELVWIENRIYYGYLYEVPATEYQEGSESEFDPSRIYEVEPYEVTVTKYRKKEDS